MKSYIILIVYLFLGLVLNSQTGNLQITVKGIKSNKGDIKIAVYDESGKVGFLKSLDRAFQKKAGKINNNTTVVTFTNIPYGTYAVSLFHDENSNSELDRATLGYPIEAYGVSGNIETVGPPKFDECKFEFNTTFKNLNITLQTWLKKKQP